MLEDIINLVKQHAGAAIVDNPAIPNEQNEAVTAEAGSSILDGLKGLISEGKAQEVLGLFSHPSSDMASNPAVQQISGGFVQNLVSKFGLDASAANGVAGNLIPQVLQSLVHKTNDTADSSFSMEGIFGHLTGGQGIQGLLGGLTQGGGSVVDKLKGLF
jgi:hypothetical protein